MNKGKPQQTNSKVIKKKKNQIYLKYKNIFKYLSSTDNLYFNVT